MATEHASIVPPEMRLAALIAKGEAAAAAGLEAVTLPIEPPRWMGRGDFVGVVSQLLHGEIAARALCARLIDRLPAGPHRRFVETQAADEDRHIALYSAYLARLGDIVPADDGFAAGVATALRWDGEPAALVVALHVVLEGEAVKLMRDAGRLFSCPALRRITTIADQDEARHVAFGRLYLADALAALDDDSRAAIHRWIRDLWMTAADTRPSRPGGMALVRSRLHRGYLRARWLAHERTLADLGLLGPAGRAS